MTSVVSEVFSLHSLEAVVRELPLLVSVSVLSGHLPPGVLSLSSQEITPKNPQLLALQPKLFHLIRTDGRSVPRFLFRLRLRFLPLLLGFELLSAGERLLPDQHDEALGSLPKVCKSTSLPTLSRGGLHELSRPVKPEDLLRGPEAVFHPEVIVAQSVVALWRCATPASGVSQSLDDSVLLFLAVLTLDEGAESDLCGQATTPAQLDGAVGLLAPVTLLLPMLSPVVAQRLGDTRLPAEATGLENVSILVHLGL